MSNDALKRGVDKHCSIAYTIRYIRYETCKLSIALHKLLTKLLQRLEEIKEFDSTEKT